MFIPDRLILKNPADLQDPGLLGVSSEGYRPEPGEGSTAEQTWTPVNASSVLVRTHLAAAAIRQSRLGTSGAAVLVQAHYAEKGVTSVKILEAGLLGADSRYFPDAYLNLELGAAASGLRLALDTAEGVYPVIGGLRGPIPWRQDTMPPDTEHYNLNFLPEAL